MKNWKKFSIATLGTLSILGTSVFALTGTVNAPSGLVLRQEADKGGAPLATVPDKTKVDIVEESGEWYKVKYESQEGYLFKQYVNKNEAEKPVEPEVPTNTEPEEKPVETKPGENVKTKGKIKVYMIPVVSSTVINEIEADVEVKIEKQITNWSYVSVGNIRGWVRTYGIENPVQPPVEEKPEEPQEKPEEPKTPEKPEKPTKPETPVTPEKPEDNTNSEEKPVANKKGFVTVDYANVRKTASTDSEIVTTLTKDTSFAILAETEEWYKIKYTSPDEVVYEGYMFKNLATTANS